MASQNQREKSLMNEKTCINPLTLKHKCIVKEIIKSSAYNSATQDTGVNNEKNNKITNLLEA